MDFSSLPEFKTRKEPNSAGGPKETERKLSKRTTRNLRDLAWLVVIILLLFQLHRISQAIKDRKAPEPPLLDFRIVQERFKEAEELSSRSQIEQLFGPPGNLNAWEPEFYELEMETWRSMRVNSSYPHVWDKWFDPNDKNRWVAVLYLGKPHEETAWRIFKKGF